MTAPRSSEADTLLANTLASETLAASDAPRPAPRPPGQPTAIGRFTVLRELGAGGMGVVYAAYDEQLDRKVAVKLLRHEPENASTHGHARLLREAQALARLSHPNVVAVYDVGSFQDHVFLAMEYVQGQNLRGWLEAAPRSWRDVLHVFLQAGHGLTAAHAAGLVHRDFKPENVMIGDDGRVRVLDFGLARAPELAREEASTEPPDAPARGALSSQLTVAGAVVGTPAYIAPELYARRPADARSDQFAFCVSLWEALYGQRPFQGATLPELMYAICEGVPEPPPRDRRVPAWLHAAVLRGLDQDADRRFPSIAALLAAIDRDPERRRIRILGAAVLACLVALVVLGVRNIQAARAQQCTGGGPLITSTWGHATKDSLTAAFVATGRPYARDTADRVAARLDAYTAAWAAAHRDACEDSAVRKEQSQELLDLRMACLEGRRSALAELLALLLEIDDKTLEKAVQIVDGLPAIEPCENPAYVRSEQPLPDTPDEAIREATARKQLERILALYNAKRIHEAEELLDALEGQGVSEHLAPRIALMRGRIASDLSRFPESRSAFQRAYFMARRRSDDATSQKAALGMLDAIDDDHRMRDLWELWAQLAEVEIARSDALNDRLELQRLRARRLIRESDFAGARDLLAGAVAECEATERCRSTAVIIWLVADLGLTHERLGDGEQALAFQRRHLAERIRLYGPRHPNIATALDRISGAQLSLGRLEEARAAAEQALALRLETYGTEHWLVAESFNNLATVLIELGDIGGALTYLRETARIEAKVFGPESQQIGITLSNIGIALHNLRYDPEALQTLQRAYGILRASLSPDNTQILPSVHTLAAVEQSLGRLDDAELHLREALRIALLRLGDGHPHTALIRQSLASLLHAKGRTHEAIDFLRSARERLVAKAGEEHHSLTLIDATLGDFAAAVGDSASAVAHLRRALALYERTRPADSAEPIYPLVILSPLLLDSDPAEALRIAERADELARGVQLHPSVQASLHFALAAALVRTGGDRARAVASACIADRAVAGDDSAQKLRKKLRALDLLSACPR